MENSRKNPSINIADIESYVVCNNDEIIQYFVMNDKIYFYDTSAFWNHAQTNDRDVIIEYIRKTSGIVVILRSVLLELCSRDLELRKEHIDYIKCMSVSGIKIVVMYEEDVFDILKAYCSDGNMINEWLMYSIKCIKSKVGVIERVINDNPKIKNEQKIIDILIEGHRDDQIHIYASEEYELFPTEKSMTLSELAKNIMLNKITVYS